MKRMVFVVVVLLFAMAISANAFTFTKWQVTTSELKQTSPVMSGNSVYWRQWYSGSESNIWTQDLQTKQERPIVERLTEKTPVASSGDYLLYHESIEGDPNWYDTSLYNTATREDILIALGPENQVAHDIWNNKVIYTTGFAWPDSYLYDINTGETRLLANEAIRPRIWGNTAVWIKSYGFGYSTVVSCNLQTGEITQVPTANDHNQSLPDIYQDKVVWSGLNDNLGIFYKNLTTGEERKIADSGEYPVIWGDFIAWNQADDTGVYNIYAYSISSGETLKVSDNESQTWAWEPYGAPYLYENTVLWTSGSINGYGNIFAAQLNPVPEPSSFLALCGGVAGLLAIRRRRK